MAVTYILFVLGFILLVYGANWLVDGAASIARRYQISHVVIGLTIVALGTSAPELVVNLIASYQGTADVALGNILGSNISNIFLILGISALVFPLAVNRNTLWKEIPFALGGAVLFGLLANNLIFASWSDPRIARVDGLVLILFFLLFMVYTFSIARIKGRSIHAEYQVKEYPVMLSMLMIAGGMITLVLGGRWIVSGAVSIAAGLGMSEAVISLTIVAIGTSLPELATCVAAAMKRNADIVIGNILGSNIFNIFFVMGTSALVRPLAFNQVMNFDVLVGVFSVLLLWIFLVISRRNTLTRWQGGLFLVLYVAYIVFLITG
ncbi:MAG: calcium/sodium antiporter [Bacteroidales bacterium]|nr:calcium/sodium antiporter [Bacteroidales bacterium]